MNKQISAHFENIFSKQQTGFHRGFNPQHCVLVMLERLRKTLDKGGDLAVLLADLLKAFDCIPYDLIIANLHACSVNMPSLKLVNSYLTNRHQRVKVNNSYSLWKCIKYSVLQRPIFSTVLFNTSFFFDLFFIMDDVDILSYADDNTSYTHGKLPNKVLEKLECAFCLVSLLLTLNIFHALF